MEGQSERGKGSGTKSAPAGRVSLRTGIRVTTVESFILALLFHQCLWQPLPHIHTLMWSALKGRTA